MGEPDNPYEAPAAELADSPGVVAGEPSLASRTQRLGGAFVDGLINGALLLSIQWSTGVFANWPRPLPQPWWHESLWRLAGLALMLVVQSYFWATRAQSIGKIIAGTKIVTLDGRNADLGRIVMLRAIPTALISMVPVVGPLVVFVGILLIFRNDRRCLHDLIARTRVVQV